MVNTAPIKFGFTRHSWFGTFAYTFDEMAHTGYDQGVYYSMGYCGSGDSMASYLGMRLGQKVVGKTEGITAFDNIPIPTRPAYTGWPWFLPPDWLGIDGRTGYNISLAISLQ